MDTLLRIWPRPEDRLPSGRRLETITAQTVKLAAVECHPRRHIHVTVDGFVRDPRHRNAPAAATARSAVSTNRHQVWHRPSPPTPHSRPACSLSDAAPARTQPYRQPAPVCGAATIADDVPRHRRLESTTLDVGLHHASASHRCDRTAEGPLPPALGRLRRVCDYRQRSWFSAYRRQSGFTQVQGSTGERPELEFIL